MSCKPPAPHQFLSCSAANQTLHSASSIVRAYEASYRKTLDNHLAFFNSCNLEACLNLAPLGQTDELNTKGLLKRNRHQSCIKTLSANSFRKHLLNGKEELKTCCSFSALINLIEKIARNLDCTGIGSLCVYDTSLRIGSNLDLKPAEIYLHAGVINGAKKLGIITQGVKSIAVSHPKIPKEFRRYDAIHLENILCIYKDKLAKN